MIAKLIILLCVNVEISLTKQQIKKNKQKNFRLLVSHTLSKWRSMRKKCTFYYTEVYVHKNDNENV